MAIQAQYSSLLYIILTCFERYKTTKKNTCAFLNNTEWIFVYIKPVWRRLLYCSHRLFNLVFSYMLLNLISLIRYLFVIEKNSGWCESMAHITVSFFSHKTANAAFAVNFSVYHDDDSTLINANLFFSAQTAVFICFFSIHLHTSMSAAKDVLKSWE